MATYGNAPYAEPRARPDALDRWLALGGLVGPIVFVLTFTVDGLFRPGYSPVVQQVSDLGVGEHAWILNGSLVFLGVLLVGFAASFYRTVRPAASTALRVACAFFVALVGFAVAGVFPETTPIHWLVGATCAYLGAFLAFLLVGLLLRGDPAWRGWTTYSLLASATTVVLVAAAFYAFAPSTQPSARLGGLTERVLFVEILAWYAAFGWRLFRAAPDSD